MKKITLSLLLITSFLLTSCWPPPLLCRFDLSDFTKTYEFDCSKEELKDRIVEAYTYDVSLMSKLSGKRLIENADVNAEYRKAQQIWLEKKNWDDFKSDIRANTTDTLNIEIDKHLCREQYSFQAVVSGDANKSSLTITKFKFERRKACKKDSAYYVVALPKRMERKFIDKLK